MTVSVPSKRSTPSLPDVFQGEIFRQVGKYARSAVLYAFERSGGPEGLAEWAKENPDEFYTKLFPKIIARESEVQHVRGVDDLMDLLDADYEVIEGDGVEEAEEVPIMDRGAAQWGSDFGPTPPKPREKEMTYDTDDYALDYDVDALTDFPMSDGKVVKFYAADAAKDADAVLEQAVGVYESVLVLGWTPDGMFDARATLGLTTESAVFLVEHFKHNLLAGVYSPE